MAWAAGGGFVLLSGEIGTGKTTVCRLFLEQIPANCNVAYIFNPKLTVTELLQSICDEFHIAVPQPPQRTPTVKDYLDPLNAVPARRPTPQGRNNVLIIDEAQNLSAEVLEQLRLLTNLETGERKLLQIILIGQPELRSMLARPELEQLAQRVIARFHLDALTPAETAQYVRHRLEVAGLTRPLPFDRSALQRVHQLARGVPRRINLLCDRALLGAFAGGHADRGSRRRSTRPRPKCSDRRRRAPACVARAGPPRCWGWGWRPGAGLFAMANRLLMQDTGLSTRPRSRRWRRAPRPAAAASPATALVERGSAVAGGRQSRRAAARRHCCAMPTRRGASWPEPGKSRWATANPARRCRRSTCTASAGTSTWR